MKRLLFTCFVAFLLPCILRAEAAAVFLSQKEAAAAIVDDRGDPYFSRLQPLEIGVKCLVKDSGKGLEALQGEARKTYASEVLEFTPAEQEMLSWAAKELQVPLEATFPLVAHTPWRFLKVSGKLEGGLPHTRGACIVLAGPFLQNMLGYYTSEQKPFLRYFLCKLILHEQMHVVQRLHPEVFAPLYTKVWGFRRSDQIENHPWLVARNVVNPDGADTCWVYPVRTAGKVQWIWPILILNGPGGSATRMPQDFQLVAVNVEETAKGFQAKTLPDGKPDFHPNAELPAYAGAFPTLDETYHPNEIAADMVASYFAQQHLLPKGASIKSEPSLEKWATSIDWLKVNLR